jgi:hypothetical protein
MLETEYELRVKQQIEQYAGVEDMHAALPDIIEYWKSKFVRASTVSIFEINNHIEFYATFFARAIAAHNCPDVVSLGCGNAALELQIAKRLSKSGAVYRFHLIEISPMMLGRAERMIAEAGLSDAFHLHCLDVNEWEPTCLYAGVMAHHSLHHIQNLEHVFDSVKQSLLGYFCTMDVIGRNGHMRWPEVLELIELLWAVLPEKKKEHPFLPEFKERFVNWDCSIRGFEGVRAQDILPCLIERFGFERFFAYGGLIDPFVSRLFGRHYDPSNVDDRAFIDLVATLSDLLIDLGYLKPTQMIAVMRADTTLRPRIFRHRSPEYCVREASRRPIIFQDQQA